MHLQFLKLLAFSSSLLPGALPKAGSARSVHSEIQQDRDAVSCPLAFSLMVLQICWV